MQKIIKSIDEETHFLWSLYKLVIFFDLLVSFKAWFTWSIDTFYWSLSSIIVGLFFFFGSPQWFSHKLQWTWFILLLLTMVTGSLHFSSLIISNLLPVLPLFFILALKPKYKENLLASITKYLSVLVGISLIGWILYLLGVLDVSFPMGYGTGEEKGYSYFYENHVLFIIDPIRASGDVALRFCSVFVEPGYLGCLMAMLLYIGRFKKNKQNAVFFLSLLFSLSLAGYLIFVISLLGYSFMHSRKQFKNLMFGTVLISLIYVFSILYNDGDNSIKKGIIDRLEYSSDKQSISGYNRSTEKVDDFFWLSFVKSDALFFGGEEISGTVDWKSYILRHGLISFILFVSYLTFPIFERRKNRYEIVMLSVLYFLIFVSTFHLSISMMYLSLFVLGINRLKLNERPTNNSIFTINQGKRNWCRKYKYLTS